MLRGQFTRLCEAARRVGFDVSQWRMDEGSASNGIAFRAYVLVLPGHGHGSFPLTTPGSSGYLGMTKAEAYDALTYMTTTLHAVAELRTETISDETREDHNDQHVR